MQAAGAVATSVTVVHADGTLEQTIPDWLAFEPDALETSDLLLLIQTPGMREFAVNREHQAIVCDSTFKISGYELCMTGVFGVRHALSASLQASLHLSCGAWMVDS